jgi:hypothetical protein
VSDRDLSRRRLIQLLATAGLAGPAAAELAAQAHHQLTVDGLSGANTVLDQDFDQKRLEVIRTALQRNLDEFQIVRDLEIADAVEPAPIFDPARIA